MAYVRAVLKVDPEPALEALAEKIALRASADGIQLKVAVRRAQDAVEVRFDARGSSWKHVSQWK